MAARDLLYAAFHDPKSRIGRTTEVSVWVLIVLSIVVLALEPLAEPGSRGASALDHIDRILLGIFAVEVTLRVATYRPPQLAVFRWRGLRRLRAEVLGRVRYVLTPMILVDIVTVLALVPVLRGLRILRLLRLLRTVRVFQYANPFQGLALAFEQDRYLFMLAFSFLGAETILGGLSLFLVERASNPSIASVADALWWALVTITTVGFGDITPVTALGRVIGGILMVGGMLTIALFAGVVGHSLLHAVLSIREEQFRMSDYVNHIVVCGHEEGGSMLLDILTQEVDLEQTKIAVFGQGDRPSDLPPEFIWVEGDPTKESELAKARITHASTVVLAGSRRMSPQQADAATILVTFTIRSYLSKQPSVRERKAPVRIVAEILDSENVDHARAAGADEIIETRRLGFSMLAHTVIYPGVAHALSQVVLAEAQNIYVGKIPPGITEPMAFDALSREIRRSTGALVIGVRDPKHGVERINPPPDSTINPNLQVVYFATKPLLSA